MGRGQSSPSTDARPEGMTFRPSSFQTLSLPVISRAMSLAQPRGRVAIAASTASPKRATIVST
jgi:hypothetical protein